MLISFKHKGSFKNSENFLNNIKDLNLRKKLDKYGQRGVEALSAATPVDTGLTASSWDYRIDGNKNYISIIWTNSNVNKGVNIAIILQYGHATGTGGYVEGRDYINPAMQPLFDEMADMAWKEVTNQ